LKIRIQYFDRAEAKPHRLDLGLPLAEIEQMLRNSAVLLAHRGFPSIFSEIPT
jgi:hypothetical protein